MSYQQPLSAIIRIASYHVHGTQYIDEHVATFNDASSSFGYYLHNDLYTVVGVGSHALRRSGCIGHRRVVRLRVRNR